VILYGHASKNNFNIGDKVKAGDFLATQGSTGFSTGSHLHFECRVGLSNPYAETSEEAFLARFFDPRELDLYFPTESPSETIKKLQEEINDLEAKNKELRDALGSATYLNDNLPWYEKLIPDDLKDSYYEQPENKGIRNEVYNLGLNREIDDTGAEYWSNRTILDVVRGITTSREKMHNDINFVYQVLLEREVEQDELEFWSQRGSLEEVIHGVKKTKEFKDLNCNNGQENKISGNTDSVGGTPKEQLERPSSRLEIRNNKHT